MQKSLLVLTVLPLFLAIAGCGQSERREPKVVEQPVAPPTSTTMTLSAEQLMSLDWNGRVVDRSMVLDKRVVGTGVELDIRFPGNSPELCSLDHTSCGAAGQRALVGLGVGQYKAFALKFSLVSVNARTDPNGPPQIVAGAIIGPSGDGRYSACDPIVLALSSEQASGVATTPMRTQTIRVIGIHVHASNPEAWDANGGIVTIRVEPAPGAEVLTPPPVDVEDGTRAKTARTREGKSREKPTSTPTFGTQRMGAW